MRSARESTRFAPLPDVGLNHERKFYNSQTRPTASLVVFYLSRNWAAQEFQRQANVTSLLRRPEWGWGKDGAWEPGRHPAGVGPPHRVGPSARPLPITGSTGAACHRMHLPLSPPCPFHCPRSSQMHVVTFRSQKWEAFVFLYWQEPNMVMWSALQYSSFCLEEEYTPSSNLSFKMDRLWIPDILRKWHWIFYFTAEKLISTKIFPINSKSSWTKNEPILSETILNQACLTPGYITYYSPRRGSH